MKVQTAVVRDEKGALLLVRDRERPELTQDRELAEIEISEAFYHFICSSPSSLLSYSLSSSSPSS